MIYQSNTRMAEYRGNSFIELPPSKRLVKFYNKGQHYVHNLKMPFVQIWPLQRATLGVTCTSEPLEEHVEPLLLPLPNQTNGMFCLGSLAHGTKEERVNGFWNVEFTYEFQRLGYYHTTPEHIKQWEETGLLPIIRKIDINDFRRYLRMYG